MTEIQKIAHNTLIQVIGKAVTVGLGLLAFAIITRTLGQDGFGQFTTVYGFLAVFGILVDLGLQMTTPRLIADPANDEKTIVGNALTIRLVFSIIFLAAAPLIAMLFPYPTEVKFSIAVAAAGLVFVSLTTTLTSLFQKHLVMQRVVIAEIIAKTLYLILLITAVKINASLITIIIVTIVESAVAFVLLYGFARRLTKISLAFDLNTWKKILTYTWPLAVTIALNLIYFKGDIVIMSIFRSEAEVGLYGAPYRVLEVLINAAYLFLGLILPLLGAAVAANNLPRLRTVLQATFDFLIIMVVPLVIGGFILGEPLMILFAGPAFAVSGELIKILLLAAAALVIGGLFGYAVVALNAQKEMIKFYALNAIVSVVGYLILIPRFSYWGAAWMTVVSEAFILLTASVVMYRRCGFLPRITVAIKSLFASVVMVSGLLLVPLAFFPALLIGTILYFATLYLIGGVNRQALREIISVTR